MLACLCLPLFVGLGRTDLGHDESIYSFAVDRMLETGDWLVPRSIPNEDWAFLEKPPLKMWLVALSIRLGLTPHDEFGLRFWDALLAGVAFLYVFAFGRRLAGPVCGAAAVLFLFVHEPLLFDHGLRSNNMEAALVLCYCGGVYHYSRWAGTESGRHWHVLGVALCFVLGFMTKFVAALFLPLVLGTVALLLGAHRRQFRRDLRLWLGAGLVAAALCVPWFVFAWMKFGRFFWEVILGGHVYTRFTSFVDPQHLQAWHYYFATLYQALAHSGSAAFVGVGLVLLLVQTIRRRSAEALLVLVWFALPVTLISLGTSKLYHYVYPFLPPLAVAGGYVPAVLLSALLPRVAPSAGGRDGWLERAFPRLVARFARPLPRLLLTAIAAAALLLAVATALGGPTRLAAGQRVLLRNASVVRPLAVALVAGALAGYPRHAGQLAITVLVLAWLPWSSYRHALARLGDEHHPIRTAQQCLAHVRAQAGERTGSGPAIYLDAGDVTLPHPVYYYLRRLRPWERAAQTSDAAVYGYLYGDESQAPVLLPDWRQREFLTRLRESAPDFVASVTRSGRVGAADVRARASAPSPAEIDLDEAVLLLPGPYAACASEVLRGRPRR